MAPPTRTKPDPKAPSAQHLNNLMFKALMIDNARLKVNSGQVVYQAQVHFTFLGNCS
jgi:hypothetical protein